MAFSSACNFISVTGGRGGVGKSVCAANLAFAIAVELRVPVLLVDCDNRTCGDQNIITGLAPVKTIYELTTYTGSIAPQAFDSLFAKHPVGVHYLAAVKSPGETLNVNAESAVKQLEELSKSFKFIVGDLGSDLGPLQKSLIDASTALLLVTSPDVLTINQTIKVINEMLAMAVPLDMIQLVVNRANQPLGLDAKTIAQNLRLNLIGVINQDDGLFIGSVQRQQPVVLSAAGTSYATSFHEIVRRLTGGVLQRLKSLSRPVAKPIADTGGMSSDPSQDPRVRLKLRILNELIAKMDLKNGIAQTGKDPEKERMLEEKTRQQISLLVDKEAAGVSRDERAKLIKEILDESLKLGPLEDLLKDDAVTEIMVNGFAKIFVEKSGKLSLSPIIFTSNSHLRQVIERIMSPLNRRIDEKTPYQDARLKDGSRVNAIIEPLSIDGPALTIRKFSKKPFTVEKYYDYGSMTRGMGEFLKVCIENAVNVVVSGGTGSGKTTLLNCLSAFIPAKERIITVEDAAELQLKQEHVVRLETRPASMDGTGAITIRDLIRNSLRMRPNRIIVGETRDGAALDMLQAMNTGHDGSMTTTHANSPRECIQRLETLCLMAGMDMPIKAIREQISSAVQLIVQISRMSDGSRKVLSIAEVNGIQGETVVITEIFKFKEMGFDRERKIIGEHKPTGAIPKFIEKFDQKGVVIPRGLFNPDPPKPMPQAVGSPSPIPVSQPQQRPAGVATGVPPNITAFKKPDGGNSGGKT